MLLHNDFTFISNSRDTLVNLYVYGCGIINTI